MLNPPYGLLYISAVLCQSGAEVKIFDMNMEFHGKDVNFEDIYTIVDTWKPDIVGISGMTSCFKCAKEFSEDFKNRYPLIPLVGGGLLISSDPVVVMQNTKIDIGCVGEAEEIVVDLFQRIYENKDLDDIKGLALRKGGEIQITGGKISSLGRRSRTTDGIDWIPFPAYDLIDLERYFQFQDFCDGLLTKHLNKHGRKREEIAHINPYAMPLFAGRGCPFNCVFCFSTMDKKPVKHSVDYVIKHLEHLENTYGLNHFQFLDENFNINKDWVMEFCKKIGERGNKYYFTTGNRNRVGYFDPEMLAAMKNANFYDVSIGVESLDDNALKEMTRGVASDKVIETLKLIMDAGIEQEHVRCLYGFPSDNMQTLYNTIKKGNALGYKTVFALVIPLPGTRLFNGCVEKGIIKDKAAFFEELYDGDGYRNLTSFKSVEEILSVLTKANNYSEIDFDLRHKNYLSALKGIKKYMRYSASQFLEKTHLKPYVSKVKGLLKHS